jgi:hypothetical protein
MLLYVEELSASNDGFTCFKHEDRDELGYHVELLLDRGLVKALCLQELGVHPADNFMDARLTWEGSDFIGSVRDEELWRKTKEGAVQAGGFTFDLVKALAKGLVKQKIEHHTGIKLDI